MKHLFVIILTVLTITSSADDMRYTLSFTSMNKEYILKIDTTQVDTIRDETGFYTKWKYISWGVYEQSSSKLKYMIPGDIVEKTAYISNDGRHVVIVNDWPSEQRNDSLEMISIYDYGNLIKSYKLSDVLSCGYNVSSSISHFEWMYGNINVDFPLGIINFRTFELVDFRIRISDGEVILRQLDERVRENSILVYGKVYKKRKYNIMEVCHRVYGNVDVSGIIKFESDFKYIKRRDGYYYYTVLINDGKEVREENFELHEIILNACMFKHEKKPGYLDEWFGTITCY